MNPTRIHIPMFFEDGRGKLRVVEGDRDIPFEIKRVFTISDVLPGVERGGHLNPCAYMLIALAGSFSVVVDGAHEMGLWDSYLIHNDTTGLYVPRNCKVTLSGFSKGAICLVLSDKHFEETS